MTTKRRRWKVWKEQRWAPKPCWVVTSPEYRECSFPAHAEALAYADRMARTTEIELPRATTHFQLANQSSVYMLSNGGASITKHRYQSQVGIPRDDLKPLAIALLAHHYRDTAP